MSVIVIILVTSTINIKEEAAKLKQIEKLICQLNSGLALSQAKRDKMEDQRKDLKQEFKDLEKKTNRDERY